MVNLNAEIRTVLGKKTAELRARGFVPAELYGYGTENIHLSVNAKEFRQVFKEAGESTVINLLVNKQAHPVLIHDYEMNSLNGEFLNVDFHRVNMKEKITANVPLVFVGEAPAVKNYGGILVKSMEEVEVEALPSDLPHEINIDVSVLNELGESFYVRDIKVNGKFEINVDPETVVATVIEKEEEELSSAPISVADVKTEGELKRAVKESKKEAE